MKNPNGYGSVFKMPGRRRNPWAARITTGWDKDKQQYQYLGFRATKREAQELLAQHHISPISPKANITLQELYAEWSAQKYTKISKSTADNYRAAWKYLGVDAKVPMKEYRTAHVQRVLDQCEGMSKSHLQKVRTLAVMLCNHAVKQDIANKNYAELVETPEGKTGKRGRFSDLDIQKLWKNVDVPWVDTILIMIYSGMRPGEMLKLTRFSVDFNRQTITGGIKTKAGKNRTIPIHPKILHLVKKWYDKGGDALICEEGKPIKLKRYREYFFCPTLEQLKLPKLTPHCCRHTFASMMSDAGADPKDIQEIMGHASYATTADIYTHKDITKLAEAVRKI